MSQTPRLLRRAFASTTTSATSPYHPHLGYVPEHYASPIYHAQTYFNLPAIPRPYPTGTGHMIEDLQRPQSDPEALDIGIGLTESWIAKLLALVAEGKEGEELPYRLVGGLFDSSLRWAISTGAGRDEFLGAETGGNSEGVQALRGMKCGISRFGSGSHVMAKVWAQSLGWTRSGSNSEPELDFVVCGPLAKLREAVQPSTKKADFFMWDHTTSKSFWRASNPQNPQNPDADLKRISEISTPWPGWCVVARREMLREKIGREKVRTLLGVLDKSIESMLEDEGRLVREIVENPELHYSKGEAEEWLREAELRRDGCAGVELGMVEETAEVLAKAGAAPRVDKARLGELIASVEIG